MPFANDWISCIRFSCEREKAWLEEDHYAVDSSIVPRGGAKRRKSMEPRALSNVNGTLIPAQYPPPSASRRRSGADWRKMQSYSRNSHSPPSAGEEGSGDVFPMTPAGRDYDFSRLDDIGMSPSTPFFLSQKANLVQQTCPPKQIYRGLFSPPDDDILSSERYRAKVEAARRKTLVNRLKIGSPLAL